MKHWRRIATRYLLSVVFLLGWVVPAHADMQTFVGAFTWLSSDAAGTTTGYDISVGFQAKAFCLYSTGPAGTTDSVARGAARVMFGCGTSTSNRRGIGYASIDAAAAQGLSVRHTDAGILTYSGSSSGGTDAGTLDVNGVDGDSIAFIVDTQIAATVRVGIIAWGGSDITAANVVTFQEGNATVAHGLGAAPTGALYFSAGFATAPPEDSGGGGSGLGFSIGAFDGTRQWVSTQGGVDANSTSSARSYANDSECVAWLPQGAGVNGRGVCTAADATNHNFTWSEDSGTARYGFILGWVGGQFRVDDGLTDTDGTGDIDGEPTTGFTPNLLFIASPGKAESAADTPDNDGELSMGAATSAANRLAQSMLDVTGQADTEVVIAQEIDAVYANITRAADCTPNTAPCVDGIMDVGTWADPLDLEMDNADPVEAFFGMAIWGANAVTPSGCSTFTALTGAGCR